MTEGVIPSPPAGAIEDPDAALGLARLAADFRLRD
jgi:hypothetical protein